MDGRITLEDLARALGLSKFSISRALSGKPGVSPNTRDRVVQAAREMGYNHAATHGTRQVEQRNIRLIIPSADAIKSSFWIEVIDGAENEARRLGYRLTTLVLGADGAPRLPDEQVAGLVLAGRRSRGLLEPYIQLPIPKVLIGHPRPMEMLDSVQSANFDCGFAAGKILGDNGHTRIAYFTDAPDDEGRNLRHAGIIEAMRLCGGEVKIFGFDESREAKAMSLEALRDNFRPTAFACATDFVAISLAWGLLELGLQVPRLVSVIGSNDSHTATSLGLRLTTVRQPVTEIGATAIQILHWRLHTAAPDARPRRTLLTPQMIERATHGPCNEDGLRHAVDRL